jgi:hypothetical protein
MWKKKYTDGTSMNRPKQNMCKQNDMYSKVIRRSINGQKKMDSASNELFLPPNNFVKRCSIWLLRYCHMLHVVRCTYQEPNQCTSTPSTGTNDMVQLPVTTKKSATKPTNVKERYSHILKTWKRYAALCLKPISDKKDAFRYGNDYRKTKERH